MQISLSWLCCFVSHFYLPLGAVVFATTYGKDILGFLVLVRDARQSSRIDTTAF